jgi:hypothetical protein
MAAFMRFGLVLLLLLSGCNGNNIDNTVVDLADLKVSAGKLNPAFSSGTVDYTASVAGDTDSVLVTVTAAHLDAVVTVNGIKVDSDGGSRLIDLLPGSNTITVQVNAPRDGRNRTYTVIVTRPVGSYPIGGTVAGSTGALTLQNSGGDDLLVAGDGAFEFATPVADGAAYDVTVMAPPAGQACSVSNGQGTVSGAAVGDIAVTCVDLFSGLFVDDLVVGLDYGCSSGASGETGNDGQFTCPETDDISFWLGANELGPVSVAYSIMTPLSLFPYDGVAAINLARLLQSLDADQLPDNGVIVIDETLVAALPGNLDFSLEPAEFEAAVGMTLVPLDMAVDRLRDAITQYVPGNTAPIADAGADSQVITGATVNLSGAGSSDANGDTLTFNWTFVSRPAGSGAQLTSRFTVAPSFVADVAGSYIVGVLVSDGTVINYDIVVITASEGAALPAAPVGLQAVAGDALVSLSWGAVDGATGYMIYWNTTGNVTTSSNWMGPITSIQASLGGLTNGTTYYYRVAARNALGQGPLSGEVSATPQAAPPTPYTVGGNVSGLVGTVTLQNNGADSLAVSANTGFTFATPVNDGATYNVTVSVQPDGQTCTVSNGTGTIAGANVTNVSVSCSNIVVPAYTVGGSVSGLSGAVTLQNNAADDLVITANGPFAFSIPIEDGLAYSVTVSAQPDTQICSVTGGSGTIAGADVTNVAVNCFDSGTPTTSDWKWANPLPQGNDLTDVAWGNGRYVAVGLYGTVLTSDDGLSWSVGDIGTDAWLYGIVWDGTRFVAVGGDMTVAGLGNVATSEDGLTWALQEVGTRYVFSDIVWNDSRYVAVGHQEPDPLVGGSVVAASATSTDGVTWTTQTHAGYFWDDVAWNGSVFAAMDPTGLIYTSEDGVNWVMTDLGLTGTSLSDIGSDGSQFVVVGAAQGVYTSPDGLAWTLQPGTSLVRGSSITWDGNQFVVGSSGSVYTSQDGVTWMSQPPVSTDIQVAFSVISLNAVGGQYFAMGNYGALLNSPDLVDWSLLTSGSFVGLSDVTWGNNLFVAVGNDTTIRTSPDGAVWTTRLTVPSTGALFGVTWGGGQFVAVGQGDSNQVFTSVDGMSWAAQTATDQWVVLQAVAWGNNQFVAVGDQGVVLTSQNGVDWTPQTAGVSAADYFTDITWSGSLFVATGWQDGAPGDPFISTSQDGINWTMQILPWYAYPNSVASNGSQFVVVGHRVILTSDDGLTWTVRSEEINDMTEVAWSGTQFVISGAIGSSAVLTSLDGAAWTSQRSISGFYTGMASDSNRTVFVTAWGGIITNSAL